MRLIPSMDLLEGRVVRLLKGERGSARAYSVTPEAWVERLVRAGARRIHLVDLDAAFGGLPQPGLRAFAAQWPKVVFQLGGGLRSRAAVQEALDAGFDAVVGTLALESPRELEGLDPRRLVAALDLRDGQPALRGWTAAAALSLEVLAQPLLDLGLRRALVTDVARDGAMEGPGLAALAQVAVLGFQVQASGGLRHLEDLALAATVPGVVAAIAGKALLDGVLVPEDPAVARALAASEGDH
jgi:phosphoribosylformimino-5-aminoimidazole carboxamide ribotide isomerase